MLLDPGPVEIRTHLPDNNVSQVMRSNARNFWHWIVAHLPHFNQTSRLFDEKGMVFGDAHVSNFAAIPVKGKIRFLYFDFDDGGIASFFADFARFAAITKSTHPKIKIKALLQAHLDGLNGVPREAPTKLQSALEMPISEYIKKRAHFIDKKRDGDRIRLERGELQKASEKEKAAVSQAFTEIFKDNSVVDVARFEKPRGGSAESLRYWVLVKTGDKDLPFDIFEVKEMIEPGTRAFQTQKPGLERLEAQKNTFWPAQDPRYSGLRVFGKDFEIRPKKVNLYDVTQADYEAFALYTAYEMGRQYASQDAGVLYRQKLNLHFQAARGLLKHIVRHYRKIAEQGLDD